ncbi:Nuclear transcription factor Y subunit beta [Zostera marina]|uniref:Nuclear transcription factor Y subunit beta n=1 Tax=Zostera marina TaxID=29655 RepID=A0A0K9PK00_ZOSMR|nr:Nuclear transcription factor Y subunit beta [Zostera marina]
MAKNSPGYTCIEEATSLTNDEDGENLNIDDDDNDDDDTTENCRRGEKPQDGYLPIANITRIMRRAIPDTVMISNNFKDFVQECVSDFIFFIISDASLKCKTERRRVITGEDVLSSIDSLGFEDYVKPFKSYLKFYRKEEANLGSSSLTTSNNQGLMESPNANSYSNINDADVYVDRNRIGEKAALNSKEKVRVKKEKEKEKEKSSKFKEKGKR